MLGGKSSGWEHPDGTGYRSLPMQGALTVNNAEAYEAACLAGLGLIQVPAIGVQRPGDSAHILPQKRDKH